MRWTAAAFNSSNALPQAVADSFRGARVAGEKLQGGRGERVSTGKKPERAGAGAGPRPRSGVHGPSTRSCPASVRCVARFLPAFPSLPGEPPRGSYPLLPSHPGRPPSAFSSSSSSSSAARENFWGKCEKDATIRAFRGSLYIERSVTGICAFRRPAGGPCRSRGGAAATGLRAVWGARTPAPAEGGHSRSEVNAPPPVW